MAKQNDNQAATPRHDLQDPRHYRFSGMSVLLSAFFVTLWDSVRTTADIPALIIISGSLVSLCVVLAYAKPWQSMAYATGCAIILWLVAHVGDMDQAIFHLGLSFCAASLTVNAFADYFSESRHREAIAATASMYAPASVISAGSAKGASFQGEREMTVLFSDLRGFTKISEHMDTSMLVEMLNTWFSAASEVLAEHGATLDKYMGDAIMAFWNAPDPQPDHPNLAVAGAMALRERLGMVNAQLTARGMPALDCGIGICTGRMVVGDIGSDLRRNYTVIGDQVNLASRLETETRAYAYPILVNERTRSLCKGIVFKEINQIRVKGREKPARIFTPMFSVAEMNSVLSERLTRHHDVLALYYEQRYAEALIGFRQILVSSRGYDVPYYRHMISLCEARLSGAATVDGLPSGAEVRQFPGGKTKP